MAARETWLSAVRARLDRIATGRDPAPAVEPAAVTESRQLTAVLRENGDDREIRFDLGWLHWYRYHALPPHQRDDELRTAVALFKPCFIAGAEGLPGPLMPLLADETAPFAIELLRREDDTAIHLAADLWPRIAAASADHPDRPIILGHLMMALRARFDLTQDTADLDALIDASQAAVRENPAGYPGTVRGARLTELGEALYSRFRRTGAAADLRTAVDSSGHVALAASHSDGVC